MTDSNAELQNSSKVASFVVPHTHEDLWGQIAIATIDPPLKFDMKIKIRSQPIDMTPNMEEGKSLEVRVVHLTENKNGTLFDLIDKKMDDLSNFEQSKEVLNKEFYLESENYDKGCYVSFKPVHSQCIKKYLKKLFLIRRYLNIMTHLGPLLSIATSLLELL